MLSDKTHFCSYCFLDSVTGIDKFNVCCREFEQSNDIVGIKTMVEGEDELEKYSQSSNFSRVI